MRTAVGYTVKNCSINSRTTSIFSSVFKRSYTRNIIADHRKQQEVFEPCISCRSTSHASVSKGSLRTLSHNACRRGLDRSQTCKADIQLFSALSNQRVNIQHRLHEQSRRQIQLQKILNAKPRKRNGEAVYKNSIPHLATDTASKQRLRFWCVFDHRCLVFVWFSLEWFDYVIEHYSLMLPRIILLILLISGMFRPSTRFWFGWSLYPLLLFVLRLAINCPWLLGECWQLFDQMSFSADLCDVVGVSLAGPGEKKGMTS